MRFRPKFRLWSLLSFVAVVALGLAGHRIWRDGTSTYWAILRLHYGDVGTRRAASLETWNSARNAIFEDFAGSIIPIPGKERISQRESYRRQRRADLLVPELASVTRDVDAQCRVNALKALSLLVNLNRSNDSRTVAKQCILAATRDSEAQVRRAAVESIVSLAKLDEKAVLGTLQSALTDPDTAVRCAAAQELGAFGMEVPASQSAVVAILKPIAVSHEQSTVRIQALWSLCLIGIDAQRHPVRCEPDVLPTLVTALRDPRVDVRRESARILAFTNTGRKGQLVSPWVRMRNSIVPALLTALSDHDRSVQQYVALALFALGVRNGIVNTLLIEAVNDPAQPQKSKFVSALREWKAETVSKVSSQHSLGEEAQ